MKWPTFGFFFTQPDITNHLLGTISRVLVELEGQAMLMDPTYQILT